MSLYDERHHYIRTDDTFYNANPYDPGNIYNQKKFGNSDNDSNLVIKIFKLTVILIVAFFIFSSMVK